MGEHRSNPTAQLAAELAPGERLLRYSKMDEGFGIFPGCKLIWGVDEAKRELVAIATVALVVESAIIGATKVVETDVCEVGRVPLAALKGRIDDAISPANKSAGGGNGILQEGE